MLFAATLPKHISRLSELDVFAGCSGRELRRIDQLATAATIEAGRVLCRQGEVGRECFVILAGHVDVDVNGCHRAVGRGAVVGEVALLTPNGRRTATVIALTELTVLVLTRSEFGQLMTTVPTVAHRLLRDTARRLVENIKTH